MSWSMLVSGDLSRNLMFVIYVLTYLFVGLRVRVGAVQTNRCMRVCTGVATWNLAL